MVEGVGVSDEQLDEWEAASMDGVLGPVAVWGLAQVDTVHALIDEVRASHAREAEAVAALAEFTTEAVEDVDHWGSYAGDYFAEKWDLAGCLRKWRSRRETWVAALTGTGDTE